MRLIDADALIEFIDLGHYRNPLELCYSDQYVVDMIESRPTADVPQWIPCSERLPYSQEDVLCDDDGRVTIGYYTDEEVGWHDTHSYRIYPTAWMPLPEPWKGGRG